jgi:hypothetical protein
MPRLRGRMRGEREVRHGEGEGDGDCHASLKDHATRRQRRDDRGEEPAAQRETLAGRDTRGRTMPRLRGRTHA